MSFTEACILPNPMLNAGTANKILNLKIKTMNKNEMVVIERRDGVTIYGRIIDGKNRLGQYEVHSEKLGNNGSVFHLLKEAQQRMNALIGVQKK